MTNFPEIKLQAQQINVPRNNDEYDFLVVSFHNAQAAESVMRWCTTYFQSDASPLLQEGFKFDL